ncbi:MAG: FG-GAP-like repeat-containing protein [Gammaproteobacteria bacterium]
MNFPVNRSGDLNYDTYFLYQTVDGSAKAGTDYTATSGIFKLPAGALSANLGVTTLGSSVVYPDKSFTLNLTNAIGVGPAPNFTEQQTFVTGSTPSSVTAADLNGDGKPDLIIANAHSNTVSVYLNTTAPGATMPSFSAQYSFATGAGPASVITADINGDGKPDIIVANEGDFASVLLNTTPTGAITPSFAAQQSLDVYLSVSVTVADINGDGKPDLIFADSTGGGDVLLNTTPTGSLTVSFTDQPIPAGLFSASVTVADLNNDGKPDIIVSADSQDNNVYVFLNTTAPGATIPTFAPRQSFPTGITPQSVRTADINGDGRPDIIVANQNGDTVSVLLNTTAPGAAIPSFAAQQIYDAGDGEYGLSVADVNGDGRPDIIVTNYGSDAVSILLNITAPGATTPSFITTQSFATGYGSFSIATADLNNDGKPDIIVGNYFSNTVSVLLNTTPAPMAAVNFPPQLNFATGNSPTSVTVKDVNGDGLPDLVVANTASNTVSVLLNTTAPGAITPSFAAQQTFATGSSPASVTVKDVNGDGLPDLVVANTASNTVSVLLNTQYSASISPASIAGTIQYKVPVLSLSSTSLDFGNTNEGVTSPSQTVTLKNIGDASITGMSFTFSGGGNDDFSENSDCGSTLTNGSKCNINITFTPSSSGTRSTTLVITSSAPTSPDIINLAGIGNAAASGDGGSGTTSSGGGGVLGVLGLLILTGLVGLQRRRVPRN